MNAELKEKLEQAIILLDEIDDLLENEAVLENTDYCDEFSFFGLAKMIGDYLINFLDKSDKV